MALSSGTVIPTFFYGISDSYGRWHPQFARTGNVLSYRPFGCNQNENLENSYITLFFFRMEELLLGRRRSGVGVGVGVYIFTKESELESPEIRRLRNPGQGIN